MLSFNMVIFFVTYRTFSQFFNHYGAIIQKAQFISWSYISKFSIKNVYVTIWYREFGPALQFPRNKVVTYRTFFCNHFSLYTRLSQKTISSIFFCNHFYILFCSLYPKLTKNVCITIVIQVLYFWEPHKNVTYRTVTYMAKSNCWNKSPL